MLGKAPIRRSLKYLQNSPLILKKRVEVFSLYYNEAGEPHQGARDFAFWNVPQLQHKNPNVQVLTNTNMFPGPFIEMYCKDGEEIRMDLYGKNVDEIINHLKKTICTSSTTRSENFATELNTHLRGLVREDKEFTTHELLENPAHFGWMCKRQCICQEFGQVPCPGVVRLPLEWRAHYRINPEELEEQLAEDEEEA